MSMRAQTGGGGRASIDSHLVFRMGWTASTTSHCLTPRKTWCSLNRRLVGPRGRSWRTSNISPQLTFDPRIYYSIFIFFFYFGAASQWGLRPPHSRGSLDHTQRRTKVGSTPLDEWSARRTDLYPTIHNTHNRQTSTPPARFVPTVSAGEWPQTYALDRAATGTGTVHLHNL